MYFIILSIWFDLIINKKKVSRYFFKELHTWALYLHHSYSSHIHPIRYLITSLIIFSTSLIIIVIFTYTYTHCACVFFNIDVMYICLVLTTWSWIIHAHVQKKNLIPLLSAATLAFIQCWDQEKFLCSLLYAS